MTLAEHERSNEGPSTIRVILCRVAETPRVASISPDEAGDYSTALERLVGVEVARLPLFEGIELCCDRDCLLFGLALVRRILAMSLAGSWRSELRFNSSPSAYGPNLWPIGGDFLLARVGVGGELVDLTEGDIQLWMFWLGLDYILHR